MKCHLFYPPVGLYQRGETRCQANIEGSTAVSLRACNDLGYLASLLRGIKCVPSIMDYPAEGKNWEDYEADLEKTAPGLLVMSITTATIREDMKAFGIAKKICPGAITIAKGAHFFTCDLKTLETDEFRFLDFAIYGEAESVIIPLVLSIKKGISPECVEGIIYRDRKEKRFVKTPMHKFEKKLDCLPFPARDLMNNKLYTRPDTGKMMATIETSRGCPADCIFCLSPIISGKQLRRRSPENVVAELEECVNRYGINDFFFRADTFTLNKKWTVDLCRLIIERGLRITWAANSRAKPLDYETLAWMKKAGCWLVAIGLESGSSDTLHRMKKGTVLSDNINAVTLVKKAGLKTYGFYLIGFPWEGKKHIEDTLKLAKQLNCNYSEIHLAVPYEGTELYKIAGEQGLRTEKTVGFNYFTNPVSGTMFLSREEIMEYRNRALKSLYLNPRYIFHTIIGIRSFREFCNYVGYGIRLIKNLMVRSN